MKKRQRRGAAARGAAPPAPPPADVAPEAAAPAVPPGGRERLPWVQLPHPLQVLGKAEVDRWIDRLFRTLAAEGVASFAQSLLSAVRQVVELQYGPGAGAELARIEPLVRRLTRGETYTTNRDGRGQKSIAMYLEGLDPDQPFHDMADYAWSAEWTAHWLDIRAELREAGDPQLWTFADSETVRRMTAPEWKILTLMSLGTWVAGSRFPRTRAVLEALASLRPWEVFFARMPAHTSIGPHSDNMNFLLTAHLGLELEDGRSALTVGEWTREWREGGAFVCDTSYIHSAANASDRDRYVLACRFVHPGCSDVERYALLFLRTVMDLGRSYDAASALGGD